MEFLLITAAVLLVVPTAMYIAGRVAGRGTWGLLLRGYEKHGAGAYRVQVRPVWVTGKPPIVVHIAALSSFIMGQMVVPGALAALVGLVVGLEILFRGVHGPADFVIVILMLSVPTGLLIGGRLLSIGLELLQRAEHAPEKARKLAYLSIGHNSAIVLSMTAVYLVATNDAVFFPVGYACVSIIQACVLLAAARAIDIHTAHEERDQAEAMRPPQFADHSA